MFIYGVYLLYVDENKPVCVVRKTKKGQSSPA